MTTMARTFRCETAYSRLPRTAGSVAQLPATRTTNASPSERLKILHGETLESEHVRIATNGCCPFERFARIDGGTDFLKAAFPSERRVFGSVLESVLKTSSVPMIEI
jgi:hypothetical protein